MNSHKVKNLFEWYPVLNKSQVSIIQSWKLRKLQFYRNLTLPIRKNSVSLPDEELLNPLVMNYEFFRSDFLASNFFSKSVVHSIDNAIEKIKSCIQDKTDIEELSSTTDDVEFHSAAKYDVETINNTIKEMKSSLYKKLLECQSCSDINEITVEISAGVGGKEAMLFAFELSEMYKKFCAINGWSCQEASKEETDIGGVRSTCLTIDGFNCYSKLVYEGGIHRVQRTPKTEKAGRVHTSTVSVVVIPQPSEINVEINPKDLKVETMRSSGAGGQHVNKTDSAVRITHLPTGIVAECQEGRFQDKNRKVAMQKLRSRLYEKQLDEQESKIKQQKKLQMGTKGRSEKIRTYNFSQDRVTDHRIGFTTHNVQDILNSGANLQKLIDALFIEGRKENLVQFMNSVQNQCT